MVRFFTIAILLSLALATVAEACHRGGGRRRMGAGRVGLFQRSSGGCAACGN